MSPFYDTLETRDPAEREAALMAALSRCVAQAQRATPALAQWLQGVDATGLNSRAALARLPVLRKSALVERQQRGSTPGAAHDPFGGFSTIGWRGLAVATGARRVFQSPGPIYEPQGQGPDYWRMARALWAAGFRAGDLVHCSFSFHLTPAGAMVESAAHALGCTVFPGGVANTELQLRAIADLHPQGYVGTPSFLKILVDQAAQSGLAIPSLARAVVSGEAFPPSLRDWLAERGIQALQCYATADLGLIAYETPARQGLVLDEGVIVDDRAPRHRRAGARRRGGRGAGDRAEPRLPTHPFRHRRPLGRVARPLPQWPHPHPHQGLDGPRRPDHQGPRHVRACLARGRGGGPPPGGGQGPAGGPR
jgi:phenylacetate-CoA ligase